MFFHFHVIEIRTNIWTLGKIWFPATPSVWRLARGDLKRFDTPTHAAWEQRTASMFSLSLAFSSRQCCVIVELREDEARQFPVSTFLLLFLVHAKSKMRSIPSLVWLLWYYILDDVDGDDDVLKLAINSVKIARQWWLQAADDEMGVKVLVRAVDH